MVREGDTNSKVYDWIMARKIIIHKKVESRRLLEHPKFWQSAQDKFVKIGIEFEIPLMGYSGFMNFTGPFV